MDVDKEQSERIAQALQEVEDIESGKLPRESARELLDDMRKEKIKDASEAVDEQYGNVFDALALDELEKRVNNNRDESDNLVEEYKESIQKLGLNKGRIRPRDKAERDILDSFSRK